MEWDQEFSRFVRDHSPALYRTAFVLTGDAGGAADLVQDTLTSLYPKWAKVAAADSQLAYVRRSMVNGHISAHRGRRVRPLLFADVPERATTGRPESALLERDDVTRRLATLPPRQRAALVLRYLHDLDDRDAAAQLNCPQATFRSLVRRGLQALRSGAVSTSELREEQT